MQCLMIMHLDILSESLQPEKKSKTEIEDLIKLNGGKVFQRHDAVPAMICVGDRSKLPTDLLYICLIEERNCQSCILDKARRIRYSSAFLVICLPTTKRV